MYRREKRPEALKHYDFQDMETFTRTHTVLYINHKLMGAREDAEDDSENKGEKN